MTEPTLTSKSPAGRLGRSAIRTITCLILALLLMQSAFAAPRFMRVRVTFYSPSSRSRTATGRSPRLPGVAVDPRVIPLGSQVFVPGFGVRVADDTGGAIKGRRIDVRLPSGEGRRARKHGVKHLRVRIVHPTKHSKSIKKKRHAERHVKAVKHNKHKVSGSRHAKRSKREARTPRATKHDKRSRARAARHAKRKL